MFFVVSLKNVKFSWIFLVICFMILVGFSNPLLNKAKEVWGSPLQGKRIVLDPGHGGPDSGSVSATGVPEKNINLKICHYVRDYLEGVGAYVIMTRETDKDLADQGVQGLSRRKTEDLHRRLQLVKDNEINMLVSVHLNFFPTAKYHGAQTFYNPIGDENRKLAGCIQNELSDSLGNTKRAALKKNDVYLLRESTACTALVEAGFLSNPREASLLATEAYQRRIAAAIYYGILRYYDERPQAPAS